MAVKLIVTDLDGCLLNSSGVLPDNFDEAYDAMRRDGVVFAAASGRSVTGAKRPFGSYADNIDFISDNGAMVYHDGKNILNRVLPFEKYRPVIEEMRKHENLLGVACGECGAWVEDLASVDHEMEQELLKYYPSWKECSFDSIPDRVIKLALLYFDDMENNMYPYFKKFDNEKLCVQVTAFIWLDVYEKGISKGAGIKALQNELGITPEETVVFGDYLNDIPMAEYAGRSFAPENAHPKVKKTFTDMIGPNEEGSVAETIIKLLR